MSHTIPQKVIYGEGAQTLRFVPVDYRDGRPTRVATCTYEIVDLTEGTSASGRTVSSGSATLDTVNATLSNTAGRSTANPSLLTLNAGAGGIVDGRRYMLASADDSGLRELVTVRSWDLAGLTVITDRPVLAEYVSSDTFQGIEFSASFPSSVADDEDLAIQDGRRYEVRWTYTIDSIPHVVAQAIEIHRTRAIPWATRADLLRRIPSLANRVDERAFEDALAAAQEDVLGELEGAHGGRFGEEFRPSAAGVIAVIYEAAFLIFDDLGGDRDIDRAELYRERYKAQIHKLTEQKNAGAHFVSRYDDEDRPQGDTLDLFVPT